MEAIRQLVIRMLMRGGKSGIVTTLPKKNLVDFQTAILAEKFMQNGVDPRVFKNADQAENVLKQIDQAETDQIRNLDVSSGKVFDLQGKEIPPGSKIMGGKGVDDLPPLGSRGGAEDIAAPVQSAEQTIKNMIEAENKKTINKIKQRQKMLNEAIDNVSPGLSGDRKVDAQLVAEDLAERMGTVYDDLPIREQTKLYGEAFDALTKKKFDPEDLATGGRVGLKVGSGKKFLQKVFGKEAFETMKTRDPEMFVGLLEVVDMYRKRDKEGLKMYLQKFLPHMDDTEIENFIIGSDGTEGLIGELIRLGSGRDYAGKIDMIKRAQDMRKLDDLEVTEKMIRKPNADGGIMRLGFKDGTKMTRRTFIKLLSGAVAIPIIGKFFKVGKVGKTITKVPVIKPAEVPGKPEWFDALVNKVILEGDDVTKRFATKEREIIHMKKLDEDTTVRVTQDIDDGAVRVEYESPENMYGDPVQLRYTKPLPDEGNPRPGAEFDTAESGPVGRADGPDDYSIEIDEVGGTSISDLTSDVSKLKEYATGKGPTMKEIVQKKKRKDKVKKLNEGDLDAQSDYITARQGDAYDYDDYASGGIARMLGE